MTEGLKKQLVRATLVVEIGVDDNTDALQAASYLKEAAKTIVDGDKTAFISGKIELVKISETGKQSRTKLGDVA